MVSTNMPVITENDVYTLTETGRAELHSAKTRVSPLALELLIRFDGTLSLASLRFVMLDVPYETLIEAVAALVHAGLIERTGNKDHTFEFDFAGAAAEADENAEIREHREETESVDSLRRDGFFVRIARRPASQPVLPRDRKPVVLLVEDDPVVARVVTHQMEREGFEVRHAANRAAIVERLREQPVPELVLLDVMLPDVDGFDVLARIRQHPTLGALPILMLTANATRQGVIKGLWRGADGYVTKPFQPQVLSKAIRTIFGLEHEPV